MKVLVEGTNVRAKKDERPATQIEGRNWKEVSISFNNEAIIGFKANPGHWLYFSPSDEQGWFKLDTNLLPNVDFEAFEAQIVITGAAPIAHKSEEDKKAARKARRIARKEKRQAAKEANPNLADKLENKEINELEGKELKAMKRKARKAARANEAVELIE